MTIDEEFYFEYLKQAVEDLRALANDYKELMLEYKKLYIESLPKDDELPANTGKSEESPGL